MLPSVNILYAVKRASTVEILYYCPCCESINELRLHPELTFLRCTNCGEALSAASAKIEAVNPPPEDQ